MEKLTEYERRCLESIKRNEEILAALKVHSAANQLSVAIKRQRDEKKPYRVSSVKKPKEEAPVVIRRSLRTRGMPPDSDAAIDDDLAKFEFIKPSVESLKRASLSQRAIWGWDDSHVFIGNMMRGIDVLSTTKRKTISTLRSELMTAIPCRFAAHPY